MAHARLPTIAIAAIVAAFLGVGATELGVWARPAQVAGLVCQHCKLPITEEYITSGGRNYHEACYFTHVAPRCVVCARPIAGNYLKDPWGNAFHAEHKHDTPQCAYCSRILSASTSGGGFAYPDGRTVCGICVEHAVNDLPVARQLVGSTRKALAAWGLTLPYGDIPLELGDRVWLEMMRSQKPTLANPRTEPTGFTSTLMRTLGDRVVSKEVSIYLLNGLPIEVFTGTAAHELMHAWNHLNCRVRHSPALEEGSANYIEALMLRKLDTPAALHHLRAIEASTDPVYGGGYRRVKRMVAARGLAAFLDYLRTGADFPPGY